MYLVSIYCIFFLRNLFLIYLWRFKILLLKRFGIKYSPILVSDFCFLCIFSVLAGTDLNLTLKLPLKVSLIPAKLITVDSPQEFFHYVKRIILKNRPIK